MLILQAHHFLEAVMKTNGRHGAPTEHLEPLTMRGAQPRKCVPTLERRSDLVSIL